ncbi:MAG: DUF4143 domain-containing protein [Tetrasphaera sp.]
MEASIGYLPRHLDASLRSALAASPIVLLDGARATGKTTTATRLAASSVLLPRDLPLLQADPGGYLRSLPAPVLIDEWQLAGTDLLWVLKGLVDDDPSPGRFLLAGSVEPGTYGPTYPLTGRAIAVLMRPMTRAELTGRGGAETWLSRVLRGEALRPGAGAGTAFNLDALAQSGFPAARLMPDARLFLEAYAALVAQRGGEEGRDASRLLRAMRVLATLTGQASPDQRIWDAADITKVTWKHYDDLLTRVHLAAPSPAMHSNRLKRLTAYPKRLLADTALALALAEVAPAELRADPTLAGRYLESFVVQQLRPQADLVAGTLRHVRTSAGEREVDIVIDLGTSIIGLEVKLGARPSAADARQIVWLRDQLGERFRHGFVIHTGAETYPLVDGIWALPLAAVMGE